MKVTVFNVGRGSSVLIELPSVDDGSRLVGIVDCYSGQSRGGAPLLQRLVEINEASKGNFCIEFFILTHLHADHFLGIAEILKRYGSKIKAFYDPGIDPRDILVAEFPTNEAVDNRARRELDAIEDFKNQHQGLVHSISGPNLLIYEDDQNGVRVRSVAPEGLMLNGVKKILKRYIEKLKRAVQRQNSLAELSKNVSSTYDLNKTSSAIQITYSGKTLLLGGDVLNPTWKIILDGGRCEKSDVVLLSHHGAANAFPVKRWTSIRAEPCQIIISGRGQGQPAPSVLKYLRSRRTPVWSTNIIEDPRIVDEVQRYVLALHYGAHLASGMKQGDVVCTISEMLDITGPRLL